MTENKFDLHIIISLQMKEVSISLKTFNFDGVVGSWYPFLCSKEGKGNVLIIVFFTSDQCIVVFFSIS